MTNRTQMIELGPSILCLKLPSGLAPGAAQHVLARHGGRPDLPSHQGRARLRMEVRNILRHDSCTERRGGQLDLAAGLQPVEPLYRVCCLCASGLLRPGQEVEDEDDSDDGDAEVCLLPPY